MPFEFYDNNNKALLRLTTDNNTFGRDFFSEKHENILSLVWNKGPSQNCLLDGVEILFPQNSILCLVVNQSFSFEKPENIVAWQFNKAFYCIINHDVEVSCVGLIFYAPQPYTLVLLNDNERSVFELLLGVFIDEFNEKDKLQEEMLRSLLKRLIVKITRLYKQQSAFGAINQQDLDLFRQFNLIVEQRYKELHQVKDYATLLNKSPKTLANIFAEHKLSPLQIIHERLYLEAKRMLIYTDDRLKDITFALGFEETAHFSRFFKKMDGDSPSNFRENHRKVLQGHNW